MLFYFLKNLLIWEVNSTCCEFTVYLIRRNAKSGRCSVWFCLANSEEIKRRFYFVWSGITCTAICKYLLVFFLYQKIRMRTGETCNMRLQLLFAFKITLLRCFFTFFATAEKLVHTSAAIYQCMHLHNFFVSFSSEGTPKTYPLSFYDIDTFSRIREKNHVCRTQ